MRKKIFDPSLVCDLPLPKKLFAFDGLDNLSDAVVFPSDVAERNKTDHQEPNNGADEGSSFDDLIIG